MFALNHRAILNSSWIPRIPVANMRLYLKPIPAPKTPTQHSHPSPPQTTREPSSQPPSLFTTDLKALVPPTPEKVHEFKTYACTVYGHQKIFSISKDSLVFTTGNMKYSPRKLNMIGRQIKGLSVQDAMNQMRFSVKKPAKLILQTLERIQREAKPFSDAPDHQWHLAQVWVGKGIYERGIKIHGRGMHGRMTRPHSHMKIMVKWSNIALAPNRGNQHHGHGGFNVQLKPRKDKLALHDHKIFAKSRKFFYDA